LKINIETDGTISPSSALHKAANILKDHFEKASQIEVRESEEAPQVEEEVKEKKKSIRKKSSK
jgi:DNA-directed RNA polymerase alpha subunit